VISGLSVTTVKWVPSGHHVCSRDVNEALPCPSYALIKSLN
jgi:hypothetical protein